jgi:hypothetical protein
MAAAQDTGTIVQSWVSPELAEQLRAEAEFERRSVSLLVRNLIEDRLGPPPGE